ncbi:hypothetical protein B0H10DRAFT_1955267 [Mycena sp. CBHHK59/15]|nr:hypothetical protein B0H10DRAFT_1955267 [Mycena sp. CBHHK59/15]
MFLFLLYHGSRRGRGGKAMAAPHKPRANTAKCPAPIDSDCKDSVPPKKARIVKEKPPIEPWEPSSCSTRNMAAVVLVMPKDRIAAAAEECECRLTELIKRIVALDAEGDEAAAEEDRVEDDKVYYSDGEFESIKKTKAAIIKRPKKPQNGETRGEIEALAKTLGEKKKANMACQLSRRTPYKAARPDFDDPTAKPRRINKLVVINDSSDTEDTPTRGPRLAAARPAPKPRAAPKVKTETKIPALSIAADRKTPKTKKHVKTEPSSDAFKAYHECGSESDFGKLEYSYEYPRIPTIFQVQLLVFFNADQFYGYKKSADLSHPWEQYSYGSEYRIFDHGYSGHGSGSPAGALVGDSAADERAAVKAMQGILDEVHPGNTLKVVWGDKVCRKAVQRVRERQSLIAATAINIVDNFFKTKPGILEGPYSRELPLTPKVAGYIIERGFNLYKAMGFAKSSPNLRGLRGHSHRGVFKEHQPLHCEAMGQPSCGGWPSTVMATHLQTKIWPCMTVSETTSSKNPTSVIGVRFCLFTFTY